MRVALYARVSTHNGQQDPELQLRELREHCARRGWEVSDEYVDYVSGAKDRRKALDRLMADAHRRQFDAVVVWKFDRFARSVSHLLRALETFRALGIEFVSLSEQVDTSTPMGKMVFTVLGAVAELTRRAFRDVRVRLVCAHTLPEHNASTRVLEKLGMSFVGYANDVDEGPVWRWELTRPEDRPEARLNATTDIIPPTESRSN